MSGTVKSLTPALLVGFTQSVLNSEVDGIGFEVEVIEFRFGGVGGCYHPLQFKLKVISKEENKDIFNFSIGMICDRIDNYLGCDQVDSRFRSVPVSFVLSSLDTSKDVVVEFEIKISDSEGYVSAGGW